MNDVLIKLDEMLDKFEEIHNKPPSLIKMGFSIWKRYREYSGWIALYSGIPIKITLKEPDDYLDIE